MGLVGFHFCVRTPMVSVSWSHTPKDDTRPSSIGKEIVRNQIFHPLVPQPATLRFQKGYKVRSQDGVSSKKISACQIPLPRSRREGCGAHPPFPRASSRVGLQKNNWKVSVLSLPQGETLVDQGKKRSLQAETARGSRTERRVRGITVLITATLPKGFCQDLGWKEVDGYHRMPKRQPWRGWRQ